MYQTEPPAAYWRDQLIQWGPRVLFAILILIATHFVAKAVQWACRQADRPHAGAEAPSAGAAATSVGTELGRLAYWLVWLVGLIAALQPLGLSGVLTPVTALTNEVFAFLPRLLGAGAVLLRRADPGPHRPPRHRSGARRAQPRAAARPRRASRIGEAPLAVDADRHCHAKAPPRRAARSPRRSE